MYLKDKLTMLALMLLVAFFLYMDSVFADHGTPKLCQAESNIAFFMADARDEGISKEEQIRFIRDIPGISDEEKNAAITNLDTIYDNPDIWPEIFGRAAYDSCIEH